MMQRLGHVLLNYATRPMIWVLGALYLVCLCGTLSDTIRPQNSPLQAAYPGMSNWGPTLYLNHPQAFHALAQGGLEIRSPSVEVDWQAGVMGMAMQPRQPATTGGKPDFSSTLFQRLKATRKLRALTIRSLTETTADDIQGLGDLQQLEAVALIQCDVTDKVWQQLGRLPRLRYLDLSGCNLHGDYPNLESLAHLQTLILGSPAAPGFVEHDSPFLPELSRFPRLQTVVLSDSYSVETMRQTKGADGNSVPRTVHPLIENVDHLRASASLRSLFVDDRSPVFVSFDRLQVQLPQVKTRPAFVDVDRQMLFLMIFILNCLLLFLIALQIQSQFSQATCHLIPNYHWPHLIPPIALAIVGVAIHCIPLLSRGVPVGAALGVNLLCWGLLCALLLVGLLNSIDPKFKPWIMIPFAITAAGWFPVGLFVLQLGRSSVDWYLRGNDPAWAALFILGGLATALLTLLQSTRLYAIYAERGISSPPLSLDPVQMAQWQQQVAWRNSGSIPGGKWISRRLERAISNSTRVGWRPRSNLWIAGNIQNGTTILLMMGFGIALLSYGCWLTPVGASINLEALPGSPMFLVLTVFLPDVLIIPMASIWRGRRKTFAMESLRPVSRREFARQIAVAIAWDLVPLAIVYAVVLAWYVIHADAEKWSPAWTGAMILVFLARWLLTVGMILWTIVIRRDWVLLLVVVISGYTILFANLAIIFLQGPVLGIRELPPDLPSISVTMLTGMALGLGLIAWGVTQTAYRRWEQIELV